MSSPVGPETNVQIVVQEQGSDDAAKRVRGVADAITQVNTAAGGGGAGEPPLPSFYEGVEQAGLKAYGAERGIRRMEFALTTLAAQALFAKSSTENLGESLLRLGEAALLFSGGSEAVLFFGTVLAEVGLIAKGILDPLAELTRENVKFGESLDTVAARGHATVASLLELNKTTAEEITLGERLASLGGGLTGANIAVPGVEKPSGWAQFKDDFWNIFTWGTTKPAEVEGVYTDLATLNTMQAMQGAARRRALNDQQITGLKERLEVREGEGTLSPASIYGELGRTIEAIDIGTGGGPADVHPAGGWGARWGGRGAGRVMGADVGQRDLLTGRARAEALRDLERQPVLNLEPLREASANLDAAAARFAVMVGPTVGGLTVSAAAPDEGFGMGAFAGRPPTSLLARSGFGFAQLGPNAFQAVSGYRRGQLQGLTTATTDLFMPSGAQAAQFIGGPGAPTALSARDKAIEEISRGPKEWADTGDPLQKFREQLRDLNATFGEGGLLPNQEKYAAGLKTISQEYARSTEALDRRRLQGQIEGIDVGGNVLRDVASGRAGRGLFAGGAGVLRLLSQQRYSAADAAAGGAVTGPDGSPIPNIVEGQLKAPGLALPAAILGAVAGFADVLGNLFKGGLSIRDYGPIALAQLRALMVAGGIVNFNVTNSGGATASQLQNTIARNQSRDSIPRFPTPPPGSGR